MNNMSDGMKRIFIEETRTIGILNYILMSMILAFTLVLTKTLVDSGANLKLLVICYTNVLFMVMLAWNHTNFLNIK